MSTKAIVQLHLERLKAVVHVEAEVDQLRAKVRTLSVHLRELSADEAGLVTVLGGGTAVQQGGGPLGVVAGVVTGVEGAVEATSGD